MLKKKDGVLGFLKPLINDEEHKKFVYMKKLLIFKSFPPGISYSLIQKMVWNFWVYHSKQILTYWNNSWTVMNLENVLTENLRLWKSFLMVYHLLNYKEYFGCSGQKIESSTTWKQPEVHLLHGVCFIQKRE